MYAFYIHHIVQGVDYSLFIMETVEKSLEKMETMPAAPRRSFPPAICNSRSLFRCFCGAPSRERRGTIFIGGFRSKRSRWRKDRRQRSSEGQSGGPTRPGTWAAWAHLSGPSGLRLFASFAPRSSSFQILMLLKLQVIWTSFGSLKHQNIENGVFCLRRVNSRKIGEHVNYSQNHYKSMI